MTQRAEKSFHTGMLKKTIKIRAPQERVWRHISNVMKLESWADGVAKTVCLSKKSRGVGAVRLISFTDGNTVEEHIVAWNNGESFTYAATYGLPLRVYVATLSITPLSADTSKLQWQSYLNSESMSQEEFSVFYASLESFYEHSLENFKTLVESRHGKKVKV